MPPIPSATPEELLAHQDWIRRLARAIVADEGSAEDVVQDTWLAALRHPPATDRPLRPWLASVVRNFARQRLRRRRPVAVSEPTARELAGGTRSAGEDAERSEMRALLVEAVLALREPYRTVLVLRFWGGLEPREIAERQGIPPPTVRTRLRRGLGELRLRVGSRWNGERDDRAVLEGLAGLPPGSGGPSTAGPGEGTGPAVAVGSGAGGLGLGVAAAGFALVAGAFFLRRDSAVPARSEPDTPAAPAAAVPSGTRPVRRLAETDSGALGSSTGAGNPGTRSELPWTPAELDALSVPVAPGRVEVLVLQGRAPAERETVVLVPGQRVRLGRPWEDLPADVRVATTGSDGLAVFGEVDGGEYFAGVRRPGGSLQHRLRVRDGRSSRRIVLAYSDARLEGRLWSPDGEPHAGATVRLALLPEGRAGKTDRQQMWLETDAAGHFSARGLSAGSYVLTTQADGEPREWYQYDLTRRVAVPAGGTVSIELGIPRPWPVWNGVVRNRAGDPIRSKAHLEIRHRDTGTTLSETTGSDGSFSFHVLPGAYDEVSVNLRDGSGRAAVHLPGFEVAEALVRDVVLPGARLWGRVEGLRAGAPALQVLLYPAEGRPARAPVDPATGEFSLEGVEPGSWRLRTQPLPLRSPSQTVPVEIVPADVELRVDLLLDA